jgi:acyl-CoA thioesterase-1
MQTVCRWLGLLGLLLLVSRLGAQPVADPRPVILAVGESTTAGYGVPADQSYPAQLVNHGRSGSTVAMALAGLDRGLRLQPAIVLIAIGGNDAGNRVAVERTEQQLRKLVGLFVRTGARVYLADRRSETDGGSELDVSLYARIADQEGAQLMPSLRDGIAGEPSLLIADGRHPNAAGYAIIARRIFDLLVPHLQR